jgi:hypothetical protein
MGLLEELHANLKPLSKTNTLSCPPTLMGRAPAIDFGKEKQPRNFTIIHLIPTYSSCVPGQRAAPKRSIKGLPLLRIQHKADIIEHSNHMSCYLCISLTSALALLQSRLKRKG